MNQNQTDVSEKTGRDLSVGEWMLTIFLTAIPIVGIVLLFVWAFGSSTKISKANWAKAMLIWLVIGIAFYVIIFLVILGGVSTFLSR